MIPPGGQVTLFPTNVITSVGVSGPEFAGRKSGTYSRSGTDITVTETGHGRVVGQAVQLEFTTGGAPTDVYAIASVPSADTFTVTAATGSGTGAAYIRAVVGGIDGFVASDAGTVAQHLAIDLVLPLGPFGDLGGGDLVTARVDVSVQARQVDDNGLPIGAWFMLADINITDKNVTPQARSFRCPNRVAGHADRRCQHRRRDVRAADAGAVADASDLLCGRRPIRPVCRGNRRAHDHRL